MAQVRYFKVRITQNQMTQHVVEVPEWEVGVLMAQWNDDAEVIEDETSPFTVSRKLPQPRDEFERLAQRYGPKHEETPFVAGVFGNFGPGVNKLRDAIIESTKERQVFPTDEDEDLSIFDDEAIGEPVAAGGIPVSELGLDEGGDLPINLDDLADLTGDATEGAEAVA